jgi:hypothetical protein
VRTLCGALGYDINTVEFAIKDGIPYAIDFMNPAPDAELASVGQFYHEWITNAVTNLVFKRLAESRERSRYRWDAFLNPEPTRTSAVASLTEQRSRTVLPGPTEIGAKGKAQAATAAAESGNSNEPKLSAGSPSVRQAKPGRTATRGKKAGKASVSPRSKTPA